MFGSWLKPSQKALLLIYFSIPHGFARRARECDSRPQRKLFGLFAPLDRVSGRLFGSCCQTRRCHCEDASHCYPYCPTSDFLKDPQLLSFHFLSFVTLPPKEFYWLSAILC